MFALRYNSIRLVGFFIACSLRRQWGGFSGYGIQTLTINVTNRDNLIEIDGTIRSVLLYWVRIL